MLAIQKLAQMFPQATTSAHGCGLVAPDAYQHSAAVLPLAPAAPKDVPTLKQRRKVVLEEALDDLAIRFLNCPGEDISEGQELMLLMFEVEKAHWFYTDFWRERDSALPALGMREFALKIFSHTPFLKCYVNRFDTIFTKWQEYKRGVPTFGAIILNSGLDKVLMVQGWGGKSWGWPKGKLNKDESDAVCAAREVYEEIGFDVTPYIDEQHAVVAKMGEQHMKLFIIPGIPEETCFETLTRQEIKDIKWHLISDLQGKVKDESKKSKYYAVLPVLGRLVAWIRDYKRSLSRSKTPQRSTSAPTASSPTSKREKSKGKKERGGNYSLAEQEVDMAGVARNNTDTFGGVQGFSADEMFRVNAERFNIHSTYSFDDYTVPIPGKTVTERKGVHAPERFRECQVQDGQMKVEMQEASSGRDKPAAEPKRARAKPAKAPREASQDSVLLDFRFDRSAIVNAMGL